MILSCQLEIQKSDGDERSHHNQQSKGNEENAEQGVELVAPHGRKDVVKLNVDGREREETSYQNLE